MSKRIIALVLVVALAVVAFAGCKAGVEAPAPAAQEAPAAEPAEAAEATETEAGETPELTVWIVAVFNEASVESLTNQLKAYTGANVTVESIAAADMSTMLATALQADTMPDICCVQPGMMLSISENIPFLELDDLYARIDTTRPFSTTLKDAVTFNGKTYLIPFYDTALCLFCRSDVFTAAGLTEADVPETWDEYVNVAAKLKGAMDGVYSLGTGFGPTDDDDEANLLWCWYFSEGGKLWNEDGTITDDPADIALMEKLLTTYSQLYADGLIPPEASTWDGGGNNASYLNGTTAMVYNSMTLYNAMAGNPDYADLLANTWVTTIPSGAAGKVTQIGTYCFAVSQGSANPDAAKDLIAYMFDGNWYNEWIEGLYPLNIPVFADNAEQEVYAAGIGQQAYSVINTYKTLYTGYGVDVPEILVKASQFSLTFPICNALQSVCVGGMSPADAAAQLFSDARTYAED